MDVIDTGQKLTDLEEKHNRLLDELDSLNEMLETALREASGKPPLEDGAKPADSADLTSADQDGHSC